MRRMFAPFDDVLIERVFQPVADLISGQGVARVRGACLCVDASSLAWIVSRVRGVSDAVAVGQAAIVSLDVTLLLLGLAALIGLRILFGRATIKPRAINPLRLAMRPHRAVVLLMLAARVMQMNVAGLSDVADLAMLICAAAALYLGACVERPPMRRERALTGSASSLT